MQSETKFILRLLWAIISWPFNILFKKNYTSPLSLLHRFFFEAKITSIIILITLTTSIIAFFLPEQLFETLLVYPTDFVNPEKYYRFFTSGLIHANLVHLFGNLFFTLIFGRIVEQKIGKRIILVYIASLLLSTIGSSIISYLIGPGLPGLGSSGAVMGLLATAMLTGPIKITYSLIIPLPVFVVGIIFIVSDITGLFGPNDGVGHVAHLFGLLGALLRGR